MFDTTDDTKSYIFALLQSHSTICILKLILKKIMDYYGKFVKEICKIIYGVFNFCFNVKKNGGSYITIGVLINEIHIYLKNNKNRDFLPPEIVPYF